MRARRYAVLGTVMSVELSKHPLLESEAKLDEETARFVVGALILAMMHLHRQEIVCRMLCVEAIMLDSKGYPQLLDFTLAKKLTDCPHESRKPMRIDVGTQRGGNTGR